MNDARADKLEKAMELLRTRMERLTILVTVLSTLILGDGALRLLSL